MQGWSCFLIGLTGEARRLPDVSQCLCPKPKVCLGQSGNINSKIIVQEEAND